MSNSIDELYELIPFFVEDVHKTVVERRLLYIPEMLFCTVMSGMEGVSVHSNG